MGRKYAQLRVDERRRIERWRAAKVSPTEMARVLGRYRSTIFRELQRNHFVDRSMRERWWDTLRWPRSCRRPTGGPGRGNSCAMQAFGTAWSSGSGMAGRPNKPPVG